MAPELENIFFALLRYALGSSQEFSFTLTAEDWLRLYNLASKQAMVGIAYAGICKLPKDRQPPLDLALQWASEAEAIRGHNRMVNDEARRLTELFADKGRRTAILKGAANARLYPDRFMRQCGDIDIWIEGGRDSVLKLLDSMDLLEKEAPSVPGHKKTREELYAEARKKLGVSKHHVHLVQSASSAHVEAHFLVSSGNRNPFTNKRIMRFLDAKIANLELVPEGFYVPSLRFALTMQLAHIQTHFMSGGIGLKQISDYYMLLQLADDIERLELAKNLRTFGLLRVTRALMWVLAHIYGLERERMLYAPSERYGKWMLGEILKGGNFGYYYKAEYGSFVTRWIGKRWRAIKFSPFSPMDVFWAEVAYWRNFVRSIPFRIKLRKLSIRDLFR